MQNITSIRIGKADIQTSHESGQTIVEAALILVFLIPVIFIALHTFVWMQARQTIIHTAVEASKTVNITGCPLKTKHVIEQNLGTILGKKMFNGNTPIDVEINGEMHKSVEIAFTDNFNSSSSVQNVSWPTTTNCDWPDWQRKDVDPNNEDYKRKSGLRIVLYYRLPEIFQDDPLLPTYVKAESWAPFNATQ